MYPVSFGIENFGISGGWQSMHFRKALYMYFSFFGPAAGLYKSVLKEVLTLYWRGPNYWKDFAIFQLFCNHKRKKLGGKCSKVQG